MRHSFYLQTLSCAQGTQTEMPEMPFLFPRYTNERKSLLRVNNNSPSSKVLEQFYGWVELEFELDKTKGICPIFDDSTALDKFKCSIYKKVYNTLVE